MSEKEESVKEPGKNGEVIWVYGYPSQKGTADTKWMDMRS